MCFDYVPVRLLARSEQGFVTLTSSKLAKPMLLLKAFPAAVRHSPDQSVVVQVLVQVLVQVGVQNGRQGKD